MMYITLFSIFSDSVPIFHSCRSWVYYTRWERYLVVLETCFCSIQKKVFRSNSK